MSGKRWNPEEKVWEIPDDDQALLKLVHTVEPELPASLLQRVRSARQEQAAELVTQIPDDAELSVPWADRMAGKQRAGVEFMLETAGGKALLADDIGGGKTLQAITTVEEYLLRNPGADATAPRLVIAPASVLDHWRRELKKWADVPEERITIIDEKTPAKREAQLAAAVEMSGAWVLVNWEKLQKRVKFVGESSKKKGPLDQVKWLAVIADESHRAKTHDSQTAKGLYKLRAPVQIAASGTPVLNAPGELYSILHWLNSKQYSSYWAFYYSYTECYKGYQGRDVVIGVKNADDLRFELADKMVRRQKRELFPSLPAPLDPIIYTPPMSAKQAAIYAEAEKAFWLDIAQANDIAPEKKIEIAEGLEAEALDIETVKLMIPNAAARTTRLRQIATSPALLGGDDVSSKLDEAEQLVLSGPTDNPWVFFTWFKGAVDLLVKRFDALGIDARGFSGDNSRTERADLAEYFQAGDFPIICATIATAGVGINLHRAADCVFIEQDWVPGQNLQAFGRVDRKGQMFHPQRHIMMTPNTVDTGSIKPKLGLKTEIVSALMGSL
jgi:SNF2 family DNA or RNA helicase